MSKKKIERKRIIVFGFEGKNNKTETNYFSHFKPNDSSFLLRLISCGKTDPLGMISSIKRKRRDYDYNPNEDLTFLFMDCDCDKAKSELIDKIQSKQTKDLVIIKSNPCFEIWFMNHFKCVSKEYVDNQELIKELTTYLSNYCKEKDYFDCLVQNTEKAIKNSETQIKNGSKSYTHTHTIVNKILKMK